MDGKRSEWPGVKIFWERTLSGRRDASANRRQHAKGLIVVLKAEFWVCPAHDTLLLARWSWRSTNRLAVSKCAEAEAPQQQTRGSAEDVVGGPDLFSQVLESRREVEEAKEREAKGDVLDPGRSGRSW